MQKNRQKRPARKVVPNQTAKHGDYTTIYADPMSRLEPEGVARLERCVCRDDIDGLNRWLVTFDEPDEAWTVERTVYLGESIPATARKEA